jgi:hypothetical protein
MSRVDTQLLNCNRITSIEAKSGNDSNAALFTNNLDQTLILDVGDQISIERSFISEVGAANSQVIEFKGATLKENQKISYTKITPSLPITDPFDANYRMGYNQVYKATEEELVYDVKDNEAYLKYGYYINADDNPYYISLPRRFITDQTDYDIFDEGTRFTDRDETSQGLTHFSVQPENHAVCDYYRYKTKDDKIIPKLKIDGSRFALYVLQTTSFNNTTGEGNNMMPYTPEAPSENFPYRDHVAVNTWLAYNETKKISIKAGFNTSSEIADQISNQLNESETPEEFNIGYTVSGERYVRPITTTVKSPTYKLFNCANIMSMNASNFAEYIGNASEAEQPTTNAQLYYSSYQYIGVKRPELWESGRAIVGQNNPRAQINPYSSQTRFTVNRTTSTTSPIVTMFEWSETTLKQISTFLKAQELYPELFNNLNSLTSYPLNPLINSTRYLHINKWGAQSGSVKDGFTKNNALGADGYIASDECLASIPLFIEYRKDDEDVYYEVDNILADKYAYGFATPIYDDELSKWFIVIHPEGNGIGGIPLELFNEATSASGNMEEGRLLGYDPHFTAFGTACVILNSGGYITNPLKPSVQQKIQQKPATTYEETAKYFTQRYVGANNPLCQFNSDTNRYEFTQFHEAMNVGNERESGDTGNDPFISSSADAGDVVYKFNPRIESFGFSPNFKPYLKPKNIQLNYPTPRPLSLTDVETNKRAFDELNENIQAYALFDSRSGIFINDWGVDKEEWDKSLWGTMGFTYEQFHATLTENNTLLKRVDNLNFQSLKYMTTNSEQATTDTKAWVSNVFNAPMYELGLAQGRSIITYLALEELEKFVWYQYQVLEIIPQIINKTDSITISSVNLSKSMIRPYYTIRSNIITDTTTNVNGALLPIVSIVDKYSAQGDFYFGNPSNITFTITKPTYISSITTSIHDPDGQFANVNDSSAIIYKINKVRAAPPNILQEMIEEENKKK